MWARWWRWPKPRSLYHNPKQPLPPRRCCRAYPTPDPEAGQESDRAGGRGAQPGAQPPTGCLLPSALQLRDPRTALRMRAPARDLAWPHRRLPSGRQAHLRGVTAVRSRPVQTFAGVANSQGGESLQRSSPAGLGAATHENARQVEDSGVPKLVRAIFRTRASVPVGARFFAVLAVLRSAWKRAAHARRDTEKPL